MKKNKYLLGVVLGIVNVFIIGFQPIIANSRPSVLDSYIFAAGTCLVEAAIFFPLMLLERNKIKRNSKGTFEDQQTETLLNGWKNNKLFFILVGINFGVAQFLFFLSYEIGGAINVSIAQKTTVIFGLFYGYLINHEKISATQILFSFILFFGLILAITEGRFDLLEFNLGVLIMVFNSVIWMAGHAFTKKVFDRNETTPFQMVFARNLLSGIFLFSTYFIFFPVENIFLIFEALNLTYILLMGLIYGCGLFIWYNVLSFVGTSKGSAMLSATPLTTALFAVLVFGEAFTVFHLIGTLIVMGSVYFIVRKNKEDKEREENSEIRKEVASL